MALSKSEFKQYLHEFNFRDLFVEMGWNNDGTRTAITLGDEAFEFKAVAQKSGFKVLVCSPPTDGRIPDYASRKKIETKVTRLFQEHLIIYHNAAKSEQIWQCAVRQTGKPTRVTETRWNTDQEPELLFQRASGVFFELDEDENITIIDVTKRIAENFDQNNERVTRNFYERFTKEHKAFGAFLTGIDDHIDEWNRDHPKKNQKENQNKQWYVSLMLNRLMFCYFIQKKGFLDKNQNYLRDKLDESQERAGENQYHSFYRTFLLALFHEGLGTPEHSADLKAEIGTIPYLNGGLFDEHELEKVFDNIEIEDQAFERIFDFFDQYEWHLDTRHAASGRDINPDVIGYIFEKYINERAAMGAYYTKEDITDYISKNCILPFLFDETKRNYPKAFATNGEIWSMLKSSSDRYVYDSVKKGVEVELPSNIEVGLDTSKPDLLERRRDWNKFASAVHASPTEIWREVVDRRRRYSAARSKIEKGEITEIVDFITYNLNIRQFVQDVVDNTNDPKFLEHFYKALNRVTILDPTCGSGAFLFAALNILEPLYETCLQRMRNFIEDEDRANLDDKKTFGHKFPYFREVLEDVQSPEHPNLQYFIYKSIILRNLYGVDIMNEAVEVAKLRLFLKLVASVDADYRKPNLGLEPLPDIDFNIRAGNTLIGFSDEAALDGSLRSTVEGLIAKPAITEKMELVSRAFRRFKDGQVTMTDFKAIKHDKDNLFRRLTELNGELDHLFHQHTAPTQDFNEWLGNYKPFHWLSEFFEIIQTRGGFDVIIGNPPYVEYSKARKLYEIPNYETVTCGNLYANVIERSFAICSKKAFCGMIVQLPIVCTDRMIPIQDLYSRSNEEIWYSTYDDRPAKLFDGLENIRATIAISKRGIGSSGVRTTKYVRWNSEIRETLFNGIFYRDKSESFQYRGSIPKIGFPLENPIIVKLAKHAPLGTNLVGGCDVFFHNAPRYWVRAMTFAPYFWNERDGEQISSHVKVIKTANIKASLTISAVLNSSIFYCWFTWLSNCRDLSLREIERFPFNASRVGAEIELELSELGEALMVSYEENSNRKECEYKATGLVIYDEYFPKLSKHIIDGIDKVLARHYGFTDEELDFIINYDIKYRMGRELDNGTDDSDDDQPLPVSGKESRKEKTYGSDGNPLLSGGPLFD